jgi:dTDP-glucose 4,6-dehydratase
MSTVLITGAAGFVARNFIDSCSDQTVLSYSKGDNIDDKLGQMPDIIINAAAEIYDPSKMFESNIMLTQKILEWVRQNKNTKLIQIGSSSELGMLTKPGSESDLVNPNNMYSSTKGAATILCQGYARQYNLDITILRPYSLYGRYEKEHRLFPALRRVFENNETMTLYNGYHDWTYIDDFIQSIHWVINKKGTQGEIYHIGTGNQHSNFYVLEQFRNFYGVDGNVEIKSSYTKNYDSEKWVCDTNKTRNAGFITQTKLEHGIYSYLGE